MSKNNAAKKQDGTVLADIPSLDAKSPAPAETSEESIEKTEFLKALESKKLQTMMSKAKTEGQNDPVDSPLKLNLAQAKNLKVAQQRISDLEEQLEALHEEHEKLIVGSEHLKEKVSFLEAEKDELQIEKNNEESDFSDEKKTLMETLEDSKRQVKKLQAEKEDLEKRVSKSSQSIRYREHSLESQIDILKSEQALLKKEKDKKIISLEAKIKKLQYGLQSAQDKSQKLQIQLKKFKDNSRKIVSVLRATVNNLDGFKSQIEKTASDQITESDEK